MRIIQFTFFLILPFLITSCLDNQDMKVSVGDVYLHSYEWGKKNPFKRIRVDTIEVLGVNSEFIKWKFIGDRDDLYLTGYLKYFKEYARPLDYKR